MRIVDMRVDDNVPAGCIHTRESAFTHTQRAFSEGALYRDKPLSIAGVEELPASSDGGPTLSRKHGEIGHGRKPADVCADCNPQEPCGQKSISICRNANVAHSFKSEGSVRRERDVV